MMFDLYSPLNQSIQALRLPPEYHPFHAAIHFFTHVLPPALLNPFNLNPLRSVLLKVIDFDRLNRSTEAPPAPPQRDQHPHRQDQGISVAGDLHRCGASFRLPPAIFQTVEIDGEHYWDGGYLGNPAIYPLIYRRGSKDVSQLVGSARSDFRVGHSIVPSDGGCLGFDEGSRRARRDVAEDREDRLAPTPSRLGGRDPLLRVRGARPEAMLRMEPHRQMPQPVVERLARAAAHHVHFGIRPRRHRAEESHQPWIGPSEIGSGGEGDEGPVVQCL